MTSFSEIPDLKPELTIMSGVLEHLPALFTFLCDIGSSCSNGYPNYIYIEVPREVPRQRKRAARAISYSSGAVACRLRTMWSNLDKYNFHRRSKGRTALSFMPMRQSEHLNFFSEEGLKRMIERSGAKVCMIDSYRLPGEFLASSRPESWEPLRCLTQVG